MTPWLLLLASYLLGAIPTSFIVGRATRGIDLRQHGSGNLGATNAYRVLGAAVAAPVLVADVLKGWVPAYLFQALDGAPPSWALAYGAGAIVGHVFSVFVGFRGGKGVATGTGVFLAVAPAAVAIGAVVWGTLVAATRIVSIASIAAALVLPTAIFFTQGDNAVFWLAAALAVFIVYAHRGNIRRLLRGEEHRFRRTTQRAP